MKALAIVALACGVAGAHEIAYPKRDALHIGRAAIEVTIDYAIAREDDARVLTEQFDRDRSGALDPSERRALGEYLAKEASAFVAVTVDGADVKLARVDATPIIGHRIGGAPAIALSLGARVRLKRGTHRVRFADRHKDARLQVPVVVYLDGVRAIEPPPKPAFVSPSRALELAIVVE